MGRWCPTLVAIVLLASIALAGEPSLGLSDEVRTRIRDALLGFDRAAEIDDALIGGLPRGTFDLDTVLATNGREAESLREWVSTRTRWVGYRGTLRGAIGTLMDGSGNHLDRALLLEALLSRAGHDVRLAHARLGEEATVLERLRESPPLAVDARAPLVLDSEARTQVARLLGKTLEQYQDLERASRLEDQRRFEAALERCLPQVEALSNLISFSEEGAARPSLEAAAQDYWWVQCQLGDEWVDLHVVPLAQSPAPDRTCRPADLEDELHHRLRIRVSVERLTDQGLQVENALDHVFKPSRRPGTHLALSIVPMDRPAAPDDGESPAAHRRRCFLAQDEWVPVLEVGGESIVQASFSGAGRIDPNAPKNLAARKLGRVTGLLGGLGAPTEKQDRLTRVAFELEFLAPGEPPRVALRTLYDALGPGGRGADPVAPELDEAKRFARALALFHRMELLPLPGRLSPAFVEDRILRGQKLNRDALCGVLEALARDDAAGLREQATKWRDVPSHLFAFASHRHRWHRHGDQVVLTRLNLVAHHWSRAVRNETVELELGFDLVSNEVDLLPFSPVDPRTARLEQGVLDTYLEASVHESYGSVRRNASMEFAEAMARGLELRVIERPDDSLFAELPETGRAIWREYLASGCRLVVTSDLVVAPEDRGAWRIDPATGHTVGVDLRGHGTSTGEYLTQLQIRAYLWIQEHKTLAILACIACKVGSQFAHGVPGEVRTLGCGALCTAAGVP